ncbi:nucleoside-diphosphate kinase [Actinoplanes lobatus]|uniref:Nucleoside diphosphate kinase n=1 Tax=Actinoplanes lobatus TaxID=113568 RepID=A0A7W7HPP9_9ACTN|nr:nucleoside-diphosphate kinase [Actinoplanes lobatus]MBB4754408.1 nucleoside diphosphate kinase [Actinoplanes lobatus]
MDDPRAFLLLKPDCLRLKLSGSVERAIIRAGLRIVCRHRVTVSPADVRHLWPEYDDAGHPLALAFLDRYLTGEPSEVLHLYGQDAFEAARRVKREVRSRHAEGPFANVVHGAERRGEMARQAGHLLGRCDVCAEPFHSDEPPLNPARPPGRDFREDADLAALVDELWPLVQGVPADPGPVRLEGGDTGQAVYLGSDREQTLDSTVTALWHALPGVELRHAVLLALHSGWSGGTPIAVGGRRALDDCLRTLHTHGVRACGKGVT